jgi:hypothetical protein
MRKLHARRRRPRFIILCLKRLRATHHERYANRHRHRVRDHDRPCIRNNIPLRNPHATFRPGVQFHVTTR